MNLIGQASKCRTGTLSLLPLLHPTKRTSCQKARGSLHAKSRQQIPFPSLAGQTVIVRQAVLLARFLALLRLPKVSPSGILQHRSPYSGVTAPALTGFSFQLIEHLSQFRFYFIILCYPKACALSIHLHKCYERECSAPEQILMKQAGKIHGTLRHAGGKAKKYASCTDSKIFAYFSVFLH